MAAGPERCCLLLGLAAPLIGLFFLLKFITVPAAMAFGASGAAWGIRFRATEIIRRGSPHQEWYFTFRSKWDEWWALSHAFLAVFGRAYIPPDSLRVDLRWLGGLLNTKDERFCNDVLGYTWVFPATQGTAFSYPVVYAGARHMREWIKTCQKAWHDLGPEERALLEPFKRYGQLPRSIRMVDIPDEDFTMTHGRAKGGVVYEDSRRYTRNDIAELVRASINLSSWREFVREPPESVVDYLSEFDLRDPNRIPGTWEEIGKATKAGRIAKFDARNLLSKELFNVSFAQMREWEGPEQARRTVMWGDGSLPGSFESWVDQYMEVMDESKRYLPLSVGDEEVISVEGKSSFDGYTKHRASRPPYSYGQRSTAYINTKRLPAFHKKLPTVERPMGLEDDVLRSQSQLWLGATAGGFHYDEEANVYIQLSGDTFAFLVPQNYTDVFTGSRRHPWGSSGLPNRDMLKKDPYLKTIPVYLTHLKPGDGITLHGKTYHRFVAQTHDRISLNWFFIPAWRKMEYNPADWYTQEAALNLQRLAVRQLWARTLARLWDEQQTGIIFMGTKLEYL